VQGDRTSREDAAPGIVIGHSGDAADAETFDQSLIRREKERAIAPHRAAEHRAELMAGEVWFRLRPRIEVVARIERGVAMELEERPGKSIGARARHGVEDAARRPAEFGRVSVGEDLELEYRFDAEQHAGCRARRFIVDVVDVSPVEQKTVVLGPGTVDGDLWGAPAHDIVTGRKGRLHAWLQQGQLLEGSAVKGEVANLALADQATDRTRGQVDRNRVGAHLDFFGDLSEFQRRLDHCHLANGQTNAAIDHGTKARHREMDFVLTGREGRELEMAGLVSSLLVRRGGRDVAHYNRCTRQHRALGILDGALNAAADHLRTGRARAQNDEGDRDGSECCAIHRIGHASSVTGDERRQWGLSLTP